MSIVTKTGRLTYCQGVSGRVNLRAGCGSQRPAKLQAEAFHDTPTNNAGVWLL